MNSPSPSKSLAFTLMLAAACDSSIVDENHLVGSDELDFEEEEVVEFEGSSHDGLVLGSISDGIDLKTLLPDVMLKPSVVAPHDPQVRTLDLRWTDGVPSLRNVGDRPLRVSARAVKRFELRISAKRRVLGGSWRLKRRRRTDAPRGAPTAQQAREMRS